MNAPNPSMAALDLVERDWSLSTKAGWFSMVTAPSRREPPALTMAEIAAHPDTDRARYQQARALWHANLGPIRTPAVDAIFDSLDEICGSNRQDGDKVKPAAVLDALPGLGKTTAATAFGREFHRQQIDLYGPTICTADGEYQRIPVVYLGLTANTTLRSLSAMLCRFYGLPGIERGNAMRLSNRAAECVAGCKTRLIIVDDVHFLDVSRRDGQEVANHFKWLANTFPVTFLFVGVGLRSRGLLEEGLSALDAAYSQTARRWNVLDLKPFELSTKDGRRTWRNLLLALEQQLVLGRHHRGMLAEDMSNYLFARSTGHFASLMSLIGRGCYRAIKTGVEELTTDLLDQIRIDEAAEKARRGLNAAIGTATVRTQPSRRPARHRDAPNRDSAAVEAGAA